jgi:hypothetical protein
VEPVRSRYTRIVVIMRNRARRSLLSGCVVAVALVCGAVVAPAASASISPSVTLDQGAGTTAGTTVALGMDVKFNPASGDSPKDLTVSLPPGLLSNASIDGGDCLTMHPTAPVPACQIATGTATASGFGLVSFSSPVTLDLVAPPKPGDLAGVAIFLTVLDNTSELGSPGDITVRPSSSPRGVGVDIAFADIPDTFEGVPITVDELDTTFAGLRLPASCPSTPASVSVSGDSYDDATVESASAPLHVTGCGDLPFAPKFKVTATKDRGDAGVKVTTDITQGPGEATSRSVALALPVSVLGPNIGAVFDGGILCSTPTLAGCKTIGSASATSPLYPKRLTGPAYLTGSLAAPAITIAFPAPFALTLTGAVDVETNTTTFSGLPDIPLSDLEVTLNGGRNAVFQADCRPSSGTASARLTTQNGDRTVTAGAPFSVSNCQASPGTGGSGGGSNNPPVSSHRTRLRAALTGLARGRPRVRLVLSTTPHAPKVRMVTITLPRGLRFLGHRRHGKLSIRSLTLNGAKARALALREGRLVVTLRKPVAELTISAGTGGLGETLSLKRSVRDHRIKRLTLVVSLTNAAGQRVTLRAHIDHPS